MLYMVDTQILSGIIIEECDKCFKEICVDYLTHFNYMMETRLSEINIIYDKTDDLDCNCRLGMRNIVDDCIYEKDVDGDKYMKKYIKGISSRIRRKTDRDLTDETVDFMVESIKNAIMWSTIHLNKLYDEVYNSLVYEIECRENYLKTNKYVNIIKTNKLIFTLHDKGYKCLSSYGDFHWYRHLNGQNLFVYSTWYISDDFYTFIMEFIK